MSTPTPPIPTIITDRLEPGETRGRVSVVLMRPLLIIFVRVARTYLQSLVGFLVALPAYTAMGGSGIPAGTFLDAFALAASLAVAPTVVCALQNGIELLASIDVSNPGLRA